MIYSFKGFTPVVHPSSFVHPLAAVTGNVIIGRDVYIGPFAAVRGDWGGIVIEDGCNVQESCTIHMFPGKTVYLREMAHIGHGAVIHGAEVGKNVLVGMNSVVMDNVSIGKESIIGAMAFVREGTEIPERSLCVGNPAKVIKQVTDEMLEWKTMGTELYKTLPADCYDSLKPVQPLREVPDNPPSQSVLFETWNRIKGDN